MNIRINLLPPQKKEELENLSTVGVLIKIALIAIFSLIIFYLFMHFCQWAIEIQSRTLNQEAQKFQQTEKFKKTSDVQDFFDRAHQQSSKIKRELTKQKSFYALVEHINELVPEEVVLRELAIKDGELKLMGRAFNREALLKLKSGLEESESFEKLESPISNLVSDENIDFEFKAKVK